MDKSLLFSNFLPSHNMSNAIDSVQHKIPGFSFLSRVPLMSDQNQILSQTHRFLLPLPCRPKSAPHQFLNFRLQSLNRNKISSWHTKSTPRTLVATSCDHDMPFFRNWFQNKGCSILPALCCRLPQHRDQLFLPFASAITVEQALTLSSDLTDLIRLS